MPNTAKVLNSYIKNNKPLVTRIMLEFLNKKFDYKNDCIYSNDVTFTFEMINLLLA